MPRCRIWETKNIKIVMRDFAYILGRNFNSGIVFLKMGVKHLSKKAFILKRLPYLFYLSLLAVLLLK